MAPRRHGWKWLGAAAGVTVVLIGLGFMWPQQRLEVCRCESAAPLVSLEARPGMRFAVWFLHSYDRAYFQEHYRVEEEGRLVLTHMTFKSALNGQGFEMGTYRARPDGSAELADINKQIEKIIFRLGSPDLANHTLVLDGRRLRLLDYAAAGDLLSIRLVSRPLWRLLWRTDQSLTEEAVPRQRLYAYRSARDGG